MRTIGTMLDGEARRLGWRRRAGAGTAFRTAAVVAMLVALAMAASACTTPSDTMTTDTSGALAGADEPGPVDGPILDMADVNGSAAQGYAGKHDVTPERAREIIIWQAEVIEQMGRVTSSAKDRYMGSRFLPPEEHNGEAIVAFFIIDPTDDDYAAVAKINGGCLVEVDRWRETLHQPTDSC